MTRNRLASVSPDDLLDTVLSTPLPYPQRNAMTMPRRETPTKSRDATNTILDAPFMSESLHSPVAGGDTRTAVQSVAKPGLRKCHSAARLEEVTMELQALNEPFSIARAAQLPGWDYPSARYWILKLSAKGKLRGTAWKGYRWTDAARRSG